MSDDQFTRLFKYMEKKFGEIDKRFEKMSKDIADVRASVGDISVRVEDYHHEVLALTAPGTTY